MKSPKSPRKNVRALCITEPLERRVLLSGGGEIFVLSTDNGGPAGNVGAYTMSGVTLNASLLAVSNNPNGIALSGSDLFVTSDAADTVGQYTTTGKTVNASLILGAPPAGINPAGIAVSGSDLFVTDEGNDIGAGSIGKYTTAGATLNATLVSGLNYPSGIVVSGSDIFVANGNIGGLHPQLGWIGEYTTSGATLNASLISGLDLPPGIALCGSDLFVANKGSGTVGEYTLSGGVVNASLISGLSDPTAIAISGSDLLVNNGNQTIAEYTTSGALVNPSLISDLASPTGIALIPPPATISGAVFHDRSGSGIKTYRDNGLAGITLILQKMRGGKPFGHAAFTTTGAADDYAFSGLTVDTYKVSEIFPRGYTLTTPVAGSYTISLSAGQNSTGDNFGDHKIAAPAVVSVLRSRAPFAMAANPAAFASSPTDLSALLFAIQGQLGLFAG